MSNPRFVALITGASSGLGAAFARQLAAQGYDLILVARRREKLASLSGELKGQTRVVILPADLSLDAGIRRVEAYIVSLPRLDLLVNNAGFGLAGEFSRRSLERSLEMLQVHNTAPVHLVHASLPGMIARRCGSIINVASVSAFAPMVGNVMYSATKSFLVSFSRALQMETRRHDIRIQALCPGFFHSEFHDAMRVNKARIPQSLFMSADEIARRSLSAIGRNGVVYVPGSFYKLAVFFARLPGFGDWLIEAVTRLSAGRRTDFVKGSGS
jgi:short-subunit dehydrogenase